MNEKKCPRCGRRTLKPSGVIGEGTIQAYICSFCGYKKLEKIKG